MAVQNNYRDSFFLFGSACRLLVGKVGKDYKVVLEDLWQWSKRKVDELQDVPDYPPPNGNPVEVVQPIPVEENVVENVVHLNNDQIAKLTAHAYRQGLSEMGLTRFLQSQGIKSALHIPLGKAGLLWEALKNPEVKQQYQ